MNETMTNVLLGGIRAGDADERTPCAGEGKGVVRAADLLSQRQNEGIGQALCLAPGEGTWTQIPHLTHSSSHF